MQMCCALCLCNTLMCIMYGNECDVSMCVSQVFVHVKQSVRTVWGFSIWHSYWGKYGLKSNFFLGYTELFLPFWQMSVKLQLWKNKKKHSESAFLVVVFFFFLRFSVKFFFFTSIHNLLDFPTAPSSSDISHESTSCKLRFSSQYQYSVSSKPAYNQYVVWNLDTALNRRITHTVVWILWTWLCYQRHVKYKHLFKAFWVLHDTLLHWHSSQFFFKNRNASYSYGCTYSKHLLDCMQHREPISRGCVKSHSGKWRNSKVVVDWDWE